MKNRLLAATGLIATVLGLSTALLAAPAAAAPSAVDIKVASRPVVINHFATNAYDIRCPDSYPYFKSWYNNSSPNVTAVELGRTGFTVTVSFTNWNLTGDQVASAMLTCGTTA
ncbi:hypothetical protein J2S43_001910 [Catenuloplanes nepalensis]|uniref:Uncharacterized protein n=1 Tax=Catenuloplanes nepalensis TaxID=587533 RepID=A0ABT9MQ19_9ACTN|nr:hypothetical protein [Catenuloplanes nepalensis]MDP9793398.1 hypothetical protein [Catenuloplanes nepalensis]